MDIIQEYLLFFIPLVAIQIGLMLAALIHIIRHKTYRVGNRPIWIVVCICFNIIGPVLYFAIGRGDE